jgi:hypothetical protein
VLELLADLLGLLADDLREVVQFVDDLVERGDGLLIDLPVGLQQEVELVVERLA